VADASLEPPLQSFSFARRLAAEGLGTALLLAVVIGSGIMGERLSGGNAAIALLGNTLATGAGLVVLITIFGPISGAHFNPAVTLAFAVRRELRVRVAFAYVAVQFVGAWLGVLAAHAMFAEPVLQISTKLRDGPAQAWSEFVATFGLIATILRRPALPPGFHADGGRSLHHLGLLVHRLHLLRQPRRDLRPQPLQHLRRHCPRLRARLHRSSDRRSVGGSGGVRLAVAPNGRVPRLGRPHFANPSCAHLRPAHWNRR
jgi:hypothetical protein